MNHHSLTRKLIEQAGLDRDQVRTVQQEQADRKLDFARAALVLGLITQELYRDHMAMALGLPVVEPGALNIPEQVMDLLDRESWEKYQAVPFFVQDQKLYLACSEPGRISALDDIRFMTGLEPMVHLATRSSIARALANFKKRPGQGLEDLLADMADQDGPIQEADSQTDDAASLEAASQVPVVKMVNLIIMEAIARQASDIHIEPYEQEFRVRMRLDGILKDMMHPPMSMKNAIISRLKIMAQLNIAEKRLPQDGRIKVRTSQGMSLEFRVSILPTLFGEKVVMRLLDKSALNVDMVRLGLEEKSFRAFEAAIRKPYGMVLVTGPTGSGKTTSLYSAIMELNREGVNISTVEDPVEFSLKGVNQVQVAEEVGLSFAAVLRSFLRQDPDIILVGEIRDLETAEIAVKAALTGHLVLATLHTNDAVSTLSRLVNMGVDDFLAASAVNAIMSQRLVRRLCPSCKVPDELDGQYLMDMGLDPQEAESAEIFRSAGCSQCSQTGYRGRTGLYEVLTVSPKIQELILARASEAELKRKAVQEGMITMRKSGLNKMVQGITSASEVLRSTAS
ncbi:type IV-A pilus assembly ATPase PilB [Desulfonatronovibrio hydrogenovorans]|uniref:type IV-A pilus assembly ATPase PilB n=1 Tax=Desulfonatronovibrio hydrogenovorans TaxID=53245 RepID=UPI0004909265|nr:type IV-A pilus assembly ATPase PilB [Desulfonatronovibrio hydrogenovorans]